MKSPKVATKTIQPWIERAHYQTGPEWELTVGIINMGQWTQRVRRAQSYKAADYCPYGSSSSFNCMTCVVNDNCLIIHVILGLSCIVLRSERWPEECQDI